MARWLLDCEPFCGHPWRLGLATDASECEELSRLRYDVFFREHGYGVSPNHDDVGRDVDSFDAWCDHLFLRDVKRQRMIGTYRVIAGAEALRRGGFYGEAEFDLTPLEPIAPLILQGSRVCIAPDYRDGLTIQYLSYGMELLLRERQCQYFLGADSFRADNIDTVNRIAAYVRHFAADPDWSVQPLPENRVAGLNAVTPNRSDKHLLPSVIRLDLRLGFRACSPPAWDPEFRCYDFLMLARRDRMSRSYLSFIDRIERACRPLETDVRESR